MGSLKRGFVYSLLLAIGLLLAGFAALLWVNDSREQRYQDELTDMRRQLYDCTIKLSQLHRSHPAPRVMTDSTQTNWPADSTVAQ